MVDWISPDYPYKVIMVKGTTGGALNKQEYICEAEPATLTSTPTWRIRKMVYDATGFQTQVLWASGDRTFTKIADNYATYTYS